MRTSCDRVGRGGARNGLNVIAENIQDVAQNTDRFLVLGREADSAQRPERTSLVFSAAGRAGRAARGADAVRARSINCNDSSRPQRERPWA